MPEALSKEADSESFTPLHGRWTIWYDNPSLAPKGSDWKENLKKQGTFSSIESFWSIWNNLKPASQISISSNYSIFREGIEPSWEDPTNRDGGKFVLTLPKKDSRSGRCDEYWLFTVLAVIGETLDATGGDQVNGAVVSIRKSQDRIALWLKGDPGKSAEMIMTVGMRWKKALNLSQKQMLRYQMHKDAAASGRSFHNAVHIEV